MDLDVSREGDRLKINLNKNGWVARLFVSGFLLFWLAGWTVGCVMLGVAIIYQFQFFLLIFALPFWAGWFFVVGILLRTVLGKDLILIDSRSIEFVSGGPFLYENKRVPFKELRGVELRKDDSGESVNYQLEITTIGSTVLFGQGKSQNLLEKVRDRILEEIPDVGQEDDDEQSLELEVRKKGPSDCRWEKDWGYADESSFTNHGQFKLLDLLFVLFINCFWNGIVTVFLIAPFQEDGAFSFWIYLFLIPFVLIGLIMLFGLACTLLEPWRQTNWRFNSLEIVRTHRFFSIPFTKRWTIKGRVRMSLSREESALKKSDLKQMKIRRSDGDDFEIVFHFDDDSKIHWSQLTRGEAEWLTTQLEKDRSDFVVDNSMNERTMNEKNKDIAAV